MRLAVALLASAACAFGQVCVPGRILPADTVAGTLDSGSCVLSDGSAYAAYRLDLPVRGQMQIDLGDTASSVALILRDNAGGRIDSGATIHRAMEAGSYSVVVNGKGAYWVKTSFTAEPGMMCAGFPTAGLSQTIAGKLGVSGCLAPDGTPYEGYSVHTMGAGTLSVSLDSMDFTGILTVRDGDGYAMASGTAQVEALVDGDSPYEIVVSSADGTGAYRLTTSFLAADDETCVPSATFTDLGSDQSAITADGCTMAMAGNGLSYFNYYPLTVASAGVADLSVASTDISPTIYLLDDGGNVLASDREVRMALRAGSYIAEVVSVAPATGAYSLTYQFTAGSAPPCVAAAANPGDVPAGSLTAASCRTGAGVADLYAVTAAASGTLDVAQNAMGFNGVVMLRDAKDNLMALDPSHVSADVAAGTYYILAAGNSGSGSYQLTYTFTQHDLSPCNSVEALTVNSGYIQLLGPGSCRGADGQPVDLYQFTLATDGVVAAVMTSSQVDGFLSLTDTAGQVLRSDQNSYGQGEPLIAQFLPAGTYQLAARAASGTAGGYYRVDLLAAPGSRPAFCGTAGKLTLGASAAGTLTYGSCQYPGGTFADVYEVDLADDTTVDLRLNSGDFDAYLVVLDAKGNVVDEDDNSGGAANAWVYDSLPAGTYYVVAQPVSGYSSVGNYVVSLGQGQ